MAKNMVLTCLHSRLLKFPLMGFHTTPGHALPWLSLPSAAVLALRRHTEHVFGAGLREEIFVPLSRAAREGVGPLWGMGMPLAGKNMEQWGSPKMGGTQNGWFLVLGKIPMKRWMI